MLNNRQGNAIMGRRTSYYRTSMYFGRNACMHVDGILVPMLILREKIGEGYFPHGEGNIPI